MIRITIELVPWGDESLKRTLTTGEIWNDGSSKSKSVGNYGFKLMDCGRVRKRVFRSGNIFGFRRKKMTVWSLLERVLSSANLR